MNQKNLLIASTSTVYGLPYLEYLKKEITELFKGVSTITFIPYARPGGISHDEYTTTAREFFESINKSLTGIHESTNAENDISDSEGLFVGGGNTFVLLKQLYDQNLIDIIREKISYGIPYLGTSAGSNILGMTISTTNDMPIVYPPSFNALGAVNFNINPHYLDPDPTSQHMGETRETRIKEFLEFNNLPVVGLREGSYLRVKGNSITLGGDHTLRLFHRDSDPMELNKDQDLSFLLSD